LRTPDSAPAGHIKSLVNVPKDGLYSNEAEVSAMRFYTSPIDKIRGKRVRISGWIKANEVRGCAGMAMFLYSSDGKCLAWDDMSCVRPIHDTTDWQKYQIVQDVPPDAARIAVAAQLFCSGEIWTDDFQVDVVGKDVPLTDNQYWQIYSPIAPQYTVALDRAVQHDGHATTCLRSRTAPALGYAQLYHYELHPDEFRGHRIRMTAWIKSSGISQGSGLAIYTFGPWDKALTNEGQRHHRPITGTRDWQQYSAVCDIPKDATSIWWCLTMNGHGKLWIDLDSVHVDIADDASNPPIAPAQ
jgi:hypothetical protein